MSTFQTFTYHNNITNIKVFKYCGDYMMIIIYLNWMFGEKWRVEHARCGSRSLRAILMAAFMSS